jgi:hypothetical protein
MEKVKISYEKRPPIDKLDKAGRIILAQACFLIGNQ